MKLSLKVNKFYRVFFIQFLHLSIIPTFVADKKTLLKMLKPTIFFSFYNSNIVD